jgi:hypothetical protein
MNWVNRMGAMCLLALLVVGASVGSATAADSHYAMVGIRNPTNVTVTYQFRWGENGAWQTYVLAPGQNYWYSWTYDYPNQNTSPVPYVRFSCDLTGGLSVTEYRLHANASPVQRYAFAKEYVFRRTGGGYLVDLYAS